MTIFLWAFAIFFSYTPTVDIYEIFYVSLLNAQLCTFSHPMILCKVLQVFCVCCILLRVTSCSNTFRFIVTLSHL